MKTADAARHPFLAGLSPEQVALVLREAHEQQFSSDEVIFREGDPAGLFYLIDSGRVSLESRTCRGETLPIEEIGAGEVLGWSWLFPPYAWHFQARALEPTSALVCNAAKILVACEDCHEIGYVLMKRMAQVLIRRLQATRRQLARANSLASRQVAEIPALTETATALNLGLGQPAPGESKVLLPKH